MLPPLPLPFSSPDNIFHHSHPVFLLIDQNHGGTIFTLNRSLGTDRSRQTHGTGHEVGEDLVRARRLICLVLLEVGDLQGRVLGGGKRAVEGRLGGISNSSLLLAGGDGGAGGGGQLLASARAQQGTGCGGESHDG